MSLDGSTFWIPVWMHLSLCSTEVTTYFENLLPKSLVTFSRSFMLSLMMIFIVRRLAFLIDNCYSSFMFWSYSLLKVYFFRDVAEVTDSWELSWFSIATTFIL